MKSQRKVLFLDEDKAVCKSFAETLKSANFELLTLNNTKDIDKSIIKQDLDLVVFCAPKNSKKTELCRHILKNHPQFPVLAVLSNACPFAKEFPQDEFHRLRRPLMRKALFLQDVEQLVRIGGMQARIRNLESRLNNQPSPVVIDPFNPHFDTLELGLVIDKTLKHFGNQLQCENIYWIEYSEFCNLAISGDRGESQGFNRSIKVRAFKEAPYEKIYSRAHEFSRLGEIGSKFSAVRRLSKDEYHHLLVPVFDDTGKRILAYLIFESIHDKSVDFVEGLIVETLGFLARHLRFSVDYWNAQNQAFVDDLTDLYNQRYLPLVLENEISRANRTQKNFCVLFLDVDYFKSVNDTRGHWIGSKVLVELGRLIKGSVRSSDYAFRYGGDEFVVVLIDSDTHSAEKVAERIRKKVEQTTFSIDGNDLNVTVSIGLAAYPDHARTSEQVIQMADQAMYHGKNKSRNIVYIAS